MCDALGAAFVERCVRLNACCWIAQIRTYSSIAVYLNVNIQARIFTSKHTAIERYVLIWGNLAAGSKPERTEKGTACNWAQRHVCWRWCTPTLFLMEKLMKLVSTSTW